MSRIEKYQDQSPLEYIIQGPSPNFPERFGLDDDILGLAQHNNMRGAAATLIFQRFDTVCMDIVGANSDRRNEYVKSGTGDSVLVADLTISNLQAFTIHRTEIGRELHYTVERADEGSDTGGFKMVRKEGGTVLLSLNQEMDDLDGDRDDYTRAMRDAHNGGVVLDEHTEEYVEALGQVLRFLDVFSTAYNIPRDNNGYKETNEGFRKRMHGLHKAEHSLKSKALKAVQPVARRAVNAFFAVTTSETKLGERKPSLGKLAIIGLVAPVPFYSSRLVEDVPYLLRPATIELVSDTAHALLDDKALTPEEIARDTFRAGNADLPAGSIDELGVMQPIVVVSDAGAEVAAYAENQTILMGGDNDAITGFAPLRVNFVGMLASGECASIDIDANVQTGHYAIAGLSSGDVAGLEATANRERVSVCNTSGKSIFPESRKFYIDVEK